MGAYRTTQSVTDCTVWPGAGYSKSVLPGALSLGVVLPLAMASVTNTLYADLQPWPSGNSAQGSVMGHFISPTYLCYQLAYPGLTLHFPSHGALMRSQKPAGSLKTQILSQYVQKSHEEGFFDITAYTLI